MIHRNCINKEFRSPRWVSSITVVLITIYVVGSLELGSFHALLHDQEPSLHSAVNESDPCHQVIYHQRKAGCEHKFHITSHKRCPLCHLVVQPLSWEDVAQEQALVTQHLQYCCYAFDSYNSTPLFSWPSRGPPVSLIAA